MTLPTVSLLLAALDASCDAALTRAVSARLAPDGGTWEVACGSGVSVVLTRSSADGELRRRDVSLSGVAPALAVEVVVLAARALRVPPPDVASPSRPDTHSSALTSPPSMTAPDVEPAPEASAPATSSDPPAPVAQPARAPDFAATLPGVRPRSSRLGPVAKVDVRGFVGSGTWLVGAGGGFAFGAFRGTLGLAYGASSSGPFDVRVVALEIAGSLSIACIGSGRTTGCARATADLGAAFVSSAASESVTTASGVSPLLSGGLAIEVARELGGARAALALTAGATSGPRALVDGARGPAWTGMTLGTAWSVAWP